MRSGTTFVGDVLARHNDLFYMHEPLSKHTGIQGVDHWFPYTNKEGSQYDLLLRDFFNLKFRYKYFKPSKRGLIAEQIKKVIGGSATWAGWEYKYLRKNSKSMLIKDPLSSLMTHWYISKYGIKSVVMVRHPLAFFYSNKRLGWDFDLSNLLSQDELMSDILVDEKAILESDLTYPEKLGILWRCIYKYFKKIKEGEHSDNILFVRHEDLCEEPEKVFSEIFNFLDLSYDDNLINHINTSTSNDNSVDAGSTIHLLKRNSKFLKNYWKDKITDEEKEKILALVGNLLDYYYQDFEGEVE